MKKIMICLSFLGLIGCAAQEDIETSTPNSYTKILECKMSEPQLQPMKYVNLVDNLPKCKDIDTNVTYLLITFEE